MADEALFLTDEKFIAVKKTIAQLLYRQGMEQARISRILGLSQPMVSNYCSSTQKASADVREIAERIIPSIDNNNPIHFQRCISFSDNPINGPVYIANKNELITDENRTTIEMLTEAFLLLKNHNLSGFIPKIKINIAQAKPNSKTTDDVAAYVNGLIIADDVVIGHNGIRFGSSKHLSSLLLQLKNTLNINAIMNIAYQNSDRHQGLSQAYLKKNFQLETRKESVDILHHKGDFGIEPCSYIIGRDAIDVVHKLLGVIKGDAR